ncbi:hypothetical protein [Listeria sp. PSOL-1]|uniref:hypothetical protein n=1 Tax=Listeria sp. PSOL-1 TaxID=1844999 RepID=UPI0013D2BA57|nr:hypothetical protein [Listeria sp. PSOL-1]
MVKQIIYFLKTEDRKIIDYWFATYYMYSKEYELRREYPEYLMNKRESILWAFHKIERSLNQGYLNTSVLYQIGEDAKDLETPLEDSIEQCNQLFIAILEYLFQQIHKKRIQPSQQALFHFIILLHKLESKADGSLISGYLRH